MRVGKNIRLFKNDFMEQCTYVHPAMPLLLWGPLVAWLFGSGVATRTVSTAQTFGYFVAGLAIWTVSEYLLHRYIFHFTPHGPLQERIAYLIHGVHHDDPSDERRLLMPPVAGIAIAIPFFVLFNGVLGTTLVRPFFSGFLMGYLAYDYTHFAVHFWTFKGKRFKALRANHMRHHFGSEHERFGVSSLFWDGVFGTDGRRNVARASDAPAAVGRPESPDLG